MLERIGRPAMYEQLAEEAVELAFAALKMARILRGENPTPRTEEEVRGDLFEEAADVELCLKELGISPGSLLGVNKMERFMARWKEAKGE